MRIHAPRILTLSFLRSRGIGSREFVRRSGLQLVEPNQ